MHCSLPGSSIQIILQARILEWIAVPFSRGSPWPRDQTRVSCIAGRFFTVWVTREPWGCSLITALYNLEPFFCHQLHVLDMFRESRSVVSQGSPPSGSSGDSCWLDSGDDAVGRAPTRRHLPPHVLLPAWHFRGTPDKRWSHPLLQVASARCLPAKQHFSGINKHLVRRCYARMEHPT